jgi:hypothetical protein
VEVSRNEKLTFGYGLPKSGRQDKKGGCPETDEDAKPFGVGKGFRSITLGHVPDKYRSDNGGKAGKETKGREGFFGIGIHGIKLVEVLING